MATRPVSKKTSPAVSHGRAQRTVQSDQRPSESNLVALNLAHPTAEDGSRKLVVPTMSVQAKPRRGASLTFDDIFIEAKQISNHQLALGDRGGITLASEPFAGGGFSKLHIAEKNDTFPQIYAAKEIRLSGGQERAPGAPEISDSLQRMSLADLRSEVNAALEMHHPLAPHYAVRVSQDASGHVNDRVFLLMPPADASVAAASAQAAILEQAAQQNQYRYILGMHTLGAISAQLAELHAKKRIHNDIKPENFLVTLKASEVQNKILLNDFGLLTRRAFRLASDGGTELYMAPEALMGRQAFLADARRGTNAEPSVMDGRANDIFALGVSAMEIFLGYNPFAVDGWVHYRGDDTSAALAMGMRTDRAQSAVEHADAFRHAWKKESDALARWLRSDSFVRHGRPPVTSYKVAMIFAALEARARSFSRILPQMLATSPELRPHAARLAQASGKKMKQLLIEQADHADIKLYWHTLLQMSSPAEVILASDPFVHDPSRRQDLVSRLASDDDPDRREVAHALSEFEPAFKSSLQSEGKMRFHLKRRNTTTTIRKNAQNEAAQSAAGRLVATSADEAIEQIKDLNAEVEALNIKGS